MKKTLLFLIGLMILGSCAKTDSLYGDLKERDNSSMEIRFANGFDTKRTKGVIDTKADLDTTKLGIFAKINGKSNVTIADAKEGFFIMNDTLAKVEDTPKWMCVNGSNTNITHYYWPKKQADTDPEPTVDFYAYGPKNVGTITYPVDTVAVIAINAQNVNKNAKDLVFGAQFKHTYSAIDGVAKKDNKGYVDFTMAHQMSWISFEAKTTTDFEELEITSIVVHVDNTTGEFVINASKDAYNTVAAKSGELIPASTPVAYNYTLDHIAKFYRDTTAYRRVGDFIAFPQAVSNGMTATITYTAKINGVTYTNLTTTVKLNEGILTETGCAPLDTSLDPDKWTVANWNAANKYTYRINFHWKEIWFTATVSNWTKNTPYLIVEDAL